MGSGTSAPHVAPPSLLELAVTPSLGFFPASLTPLLPGVGAVDRPHGLVLAWLWEQCEGF